MADLYRPGQPGHRALVAAYGTSILRPDQSVDRAKLAALAFADATAARQLNALIHPLVTQAESRLRAEEEARHPDRDQIIVVEATLLIEAGNLERYDRIVVVEAPPEVQLARAEARGMSRQEAARRMSHQMAAADRLGYADYILDNGGDVVAAERLTGKLFESLRKDLADKKRRGVLKRENAPPVRRGVRIS